MVFKLYMCFWVLEYCQVCSDSDLGSILAYGKVKYIKMLEYKISWIPRGFEFIFSIQEGSFNDDLRLTFSFLMARSNLLMGSYMGKVHGCCRRF